LKADIIKSLAFASIITVLSTTYASSSGPAMNHPPPIVDDDKKAQDVDEEYKGICMEDSIFMGKSGSNARGEGLLMRGLSATGHMTSIWVDPETGNWTAAVVYPALPSVVCVVDYGTDADLTSPQPSEGA
jgi:hypothetical protein